MINRGKGVGGQRHGGQFARQGQQARPEGGDHAGQHVAHGVGRNDIGLENGDFQRDLVGLQPGQAGALHGEIALFFPGPPLQVFDVLVGAQG